MLLATKLFIPERHRATLGRPRLLAKLNTGLRASRLVLIAAPAGFGKTTLVTEWINTHLGQTGVAWLSLEAEDNDPVRFLTYLVAALQRADHRLVHHAQALLATPQPPTPETVITLLINEIGTLDRMLTLVLDDYHLITTPAIHSAISFWVEQMPPNLHLIITSRADPPFPLARWRVRRYLHEIRAQDLRFTQSEIADFLAQEAAVTLPAATLTTLEERTEGWIAGIQLAALSLQGRADPASYLAHFSGSHSYVLDYLVEEVLQRQPAAVQHFLLQTAILHQLCGPLCDAVTGGQDGQAQLEALHRANLFLVPLDNERRWYRYHHLFGDMLQKWLRQQGEATVATLHQRAAAWYGAEGLRLEAFHHALAAGDHEQAATWLEGLVDQLRSQGEFATLAALLNRLPAAILSLRPRLAYAYATTLLFQHQLEEATRWLAASEAANQATSEDRAIRGNIAAIRTDIAVNRGELASAIRLATQALADLPPSDTYTRSFVMMLQGVAYFWSHQYQAAVAAYDDAWQLAKGSGVLLIAIYSLAAKVEVLQRQGLLHQASATLTTIFDYASAHGLEASAMLASSLVVKAELHYEWNQLEAAADALTQSLARAQSANNPRTQLHVYSCLLRVASARQQPAAVQPIIESAGALIQQFQLPPQMVNDFQIGKWRWLLQQGQFREVEAEVARWQRQADAARLTDQEHFDLLQARLLLAQQHYAAALERLTTALAAVEAIQHLPHQVEALALMALAHAGADQRTQARQVIQRLLPLAQPGGFIRTLVDAGAGMAQLLKEALAQLEGAGLATSYQRPYLQELLAACPAVQATTNPQPAASTNARQPGAPTNEATVPLVEPLSERELEVLRLVDQGRSNNQIADQLIITVGTVKRHLNNIFGKLGASSRTEALAKARALGLFA